MKIIKRGRTKGVDKVRFTCLDCESVIEAQRNEGRLSTDERDRDAIVFVCPVCKIPQLDLRNEVTQVNKRLIRNALMSGLITAHDDIVHSHEEFAIFKCNCEDCVMADSFVKLATKHRKDGSYCDAYMTFYEAIKELDR